MNTSKFSTPFMEKNPLSPLKGNAFIKVKMDAEAAGKDSFTFNGKTYPLKKSSPLNDNHDEDPKQIIGEQTFEFIKDKPSKNFVAGLSLDGGSADPVDTQDRIVITPKQRRKMKRAGEINNNYIEQMKEMTIKKDSVSGGKNFYSIKNK